jgi:hypothetical protein
MLMAEAATADRPLRLSVAKTNRAAGLYLRLGFAPTDDGEVYMALEWRRQTEA